MKVPCRLFVTDLDGTVLLDGGAHGASMPARAAAALKALHASGVTVCLASGRMHESIQVVAGSLGFSVPIISYNGAMVRLADGSLVSHDPLDPEVSAEVVDYAEAEGLPLNFYQEGQILSRRFQPWWDLYEGRTCSPMREVESLLPFRRSVATKLLVMSKPERIKELERRFKPRFEGRATVLITADEYLEFMAPSASKGRALAALAAALGVPREEVVAAGDGYNDLDMISFAGTGLAMANGRQALKDRADHVVPGPEEYGVAEFIERRILS